MHEVPLGNECLWMLLSPPQQLKAMYPQYWLSWIQYPQLPHLDQNIMEGEMKASQEE